MTIPKGRLKEIVTDYQRLLPGEWRQVSAETLARVHGPVVHAIAFETLTGGDYRPLSYISTLVVPKPGKGRRVDFLPQVPRGRPRTLSPRSHAQLMQQMFATMEREFIPHITDPLDGRAVRDLCEKSAVPNSSDAYALAALNAYFGNFERARYWCASYPELVNELGRPWEAWHYEEKAFLDSLQEWLDRGYAKEHLEAILQAERRKWGFEE